MCITLMHIHHPECNHYGIVPGYQLTFQVMVHIQDLVQKPPDKQTTILYLTISIPNIHNVLSLFLQNVIFPGRK